MRRKASLHPMAGGERERGWEKREGKKGNDSACIFY